MAAADALKVAAFQYSDDAFVLPTNATARTYASTNPALPPEKNVFGQLTFEARQNRAVGSTQQIEEAMRKPISNGKRRGARQLAERQAALQLMLEGLRLLEDSDNPLYKRARKERTLAESEKTIKRAAKQIRIILRE